MLGGGVFVTQNKVLPGSYINFVNASTATASVGERGVVALAVPFMTNYTSPIEITASEFPTKCKELTNYDYDSDTVKPLREVFRHANKVYLLGYTSATSEEPNSVGSAIANAFEAYDFNVLCIYGNVPDFYLLQGAITVVKNWRDTMGKKVQMVVPKLSGLTTNHEGVIVVNGTVSDGVAEERSVALAAWVAGAMAGCKINESCTNMLYDGEYTIVTDKTQTQLEDCITNGEIAFHLVYGEVRLLEDINSLTTVTAEKGADFKYNQTIRVIDQIANDIAKLFNTKYLGKIPNNASGRVSLWGDIVKHHRQLAEMQAIENFDANLLTVEQGATKKSIVVNDVITVTNAMAQLYMTVVVQ